MNGFIAGMIAMGYVLAGLFFLKFWARSGDRLFVKFAAAFWLLALNRVVLAAIHLPQGDESWPYLLRLIAFGLIAVAILQKNTARRPRIN
ncbi:MAG TPA: DUF5985 family protein [Stellaceae bacterium]|nr:DUF5985 family protein [Stellaceae bacterium]